ncbi:MAG: 5'-methylthioadenosine nucleosidase [Ilumatobacteraceae bacterium]
MRRIAVVMAMAAEAAPIVSTLDARSVTSPSPLVTRWFDAERHGAEVRVAINGRDRRFGVDSIGTEAAALTTYSTITAFAPELVISAGTAGGWQRCGGEVGDVYVSDGQVVHHDRRIALEGFEAYGIGAYPVVSARTMAQSLGLKTGVVTTSNSLDENDDDRAMIAASGACVKDMEAAAVGYVCEQMSVPFMAVKAITDLVDHHTATAEQFTANLKVASARLADTLVSVLDWCIAREIAELS